MKSAQKNSTNNKENRKLRDRLDLFLGGFLAKKETRPWIFYTFFVLILISLIVVSEQQIRIKQKKIAELENVYKAEISKLKANNQFIPFEKNKILINKMENNGFITDEKQIYTVKKTPKIEKKRRWFRRKETNDAK